MYKGDKSSQKEFAIGTNTPGSFQQALVKLL
jgi:hypothetical protein